VALAGTARAADPRPGHDHTTKPTATRPRTPTPRHYASFCTGIMLEAEGQWLPALRVYEELARRDPQAPTVRKRLGLMHLRLSEVDQAIEHLEAAAERLPDDMEAQWQVGATHMRLGNVEKAQAGWEKALESADPTMRPQLIETVAQLCAAQGHRNEAVVWYQRLVKETSEPARVYELIGRLQFQGRKYRLALEAYQEAKRLGPTSARLERRLAACYEGLGQIKPALETYVALLQKTPPGLGDFSLLRRLWRLADREGYTRQAHRLREAMRQVLVAAATERKHGMIYARLGELLEDDGRPDEALQAYRKALEHLPPEDVWRTRVQIANLHDRHGRTDEAFRELRLAIKQQPKIALLQARLSAVARQARRWDEAVAAARQAAKLAEPRVRPEYRSWLATTLAAIGRPVEAAEELARAVEERPEEARYRTALAKLLIQIGRPADAVTHLKRSVELTTSRAQALNRLLLAEAHVQLGQMIDAREEAEKAIQVDPKEPRIRAEWAYALARAKHLKEGVAVMEQAAELASDEQQVLYQAALASLHLKARNLEKAEHILRKALRQSPDNLALHTQLAFVLQKAKRYTDAVSVLQQALQVKTEATELVLCRLALASVYSDMGRDDEAEQLLRATWRDHQGNPQVNNHLGYFYAQKARNLKEARRLVENALRVDPGNGAYLDSLGWVYYQQGQYEKASQYLKQAVQLTPGAVIYDHLGDVLFALDRKKEARSMWRKALEFDPDMEPVRKKLAGQDVPKPGEGGRHDETK